jgi:hypothetical protein
VKFRPRAIQTLLVGAVFIAGGAPHSLAFGQKQTSSSRATANSVCGQDALCSETADFAATVTNFRTSTLGSQRIVDATIRFQNKTSTPLALAYANGSGSAIDDRGNRYLVSGPNGFRGIGLVDGANYDAKFTIPPGSFADARFELLTESVAGTAYGTIYELDLTISEIHSANSNQPALGAEIPLGFENLTNELRSSGPAGTSDRASADAALGMPGEGSQAPPTAGNSFEGRNPSEMTGNDAGKPGETSGGASVASVSAAIASIEAGLVGGSNSAPKGSSPTTAAKPAETPAPQPPPPASTTKPAPNAPASTSGAKPAAKPAPAPAKTAVPPPKRPVPTPPPPPPKQP